MLLRLLIASAIAATLSVQSAQARTKIDDPLKFVAATYANFVGRKPEPSDIYSPRLNALFALDVKEAHGEVGRIDFDFWMNGQDGTVSALKISKLPVENASDREIIVAKFKNEQAPNEIHFYFERTAKGWRLDDARSMTGETWTLSLILKYGWDGKP